MVHKQNALITSSRCGCRRPVTSHTPLFIESSGAGKPYTQHLTCSTISLHFSHNVLPCATIMRSDKRSLSCAYARDLECPSEGTSAISYSFVLFLFIFVLFFLFLFLFIFVLFIINLSITIILQKYNT